MQDEKLQGNEKIEAAIEGLKKEPTQEMLAHTLTVIRRRMKEEGELIVAVEPGAGDSQLRVHGVRLDDGSCVLHRVVGVRDGSVILMGDGNLHARERCGTDDVLGHVAVVVKGDGREVDCSSTVQRCLAALWMRLLPVRRVLLPLCRLVTGRMTNQR